MKKILFLAICVMISFCGCAPPATDVSPGETSAETPEPAGTGFARLDALPRYGRPAGKRFYAEPVNDFIPSDEYGEVLPYLGKINKFDGYERSTDTEFFGFINAAGEIICDPVYSDVKMLTYGGKSVYVAQQKYYDEKGEYYADEADRTGESLLKGFVAVIAADGSFCEEFDAVYEEPFGLPFEYEYIPVFKAGFWGAIGFDGAPVLPFEYANAPLFSEGLAAVYSTDPEYADAAAAFQLEYDLHLELAHKYFHTKAPYVYINASGETVLGPFERPPRALQLGEGEPQDTHLESVAFRNGLAMNFEGLNYGFIDQTGELKIPRDYTLVRPEQFRWNAFGNIPVCVANVEAVEHDLYTEYLYSNNGVPDEVIYTLIDAEGDRLCEFAGFYTGLYVDAQGYYAVNGIGGGYAGVFDGQGNTYPVMGGNYLSGGWFTDFVDIENPEANAVSVRGHGEIHEEEGYWLGHLVGDWFMTEGENYHLLRAFNVRTNEALPLDPDIQSIWLWTLGENRSVFGSTYDEGNQTVFGVIDNETGETLIDFQFDLLTAIGDNYFARQGSFGGLIDKNGEWLIQTPLYGNYD